MDGITFQLDKELSYEDGTLFVACLDDTGLSGITFGIHRDILKKKCIFFSDLFDLSHPGAPLFGTKTNCPLLIPSMIALKDFRYLLRFWYNELTSGQEALPETWIAILQAAVPLIAEETAKRAVRQLDAFKSSQFAPALKLHLASTCEIEKWIPDAFRALLVVPISEEDADLLGVYVLHVITTTKEKILRARSLAAFSIPAYVRPVVPEICHGRLGSDCEARWTAEWWHGTAKMLMHPDTPMSIGDLFKKLDMGIHISGMCQPCLHSTVDALLAKTELRSCEERIILKALDRVKELCTGNQRTKPVAKSHMEHLAKSFPAMTPSQSPSPTATS
ncbi:hypothetical protein BDZ89DRAFT_1069529 [Hymenopellis radicata]|nr:hypothetical protein BDZ89DRAFT_1069529 [Hymenopellis radicata]